MSSTEQSSIHGNVPDTLQNLCIFFCSHNIRSLVPSKKLKHLSDACKVVDTSRHGQCLNSSANDEDQETAGHESSLYSTDLPMSIWNGLLEYLFTVCLSLPDRDAIEYMLCETQTLSTNTVVLPLCGSLSTRIMTVLKNQPLKRLEITCGTELDDVSELVLSVREKLTFLKIDYHIHPRSKEIPSFPDLELISNDKMNSDYHLDSTSEVVDGLRSVKLSKCSKRGKETSECSKKIAESGGKIQCGYHRLRHLTLSNMYLPGETFKSFLFENCQLTLLHLTSCYVPDVDDFLGMISMLTNLVSLVLSDMSKAASGELFDLFDDADLLKLGKCKQLRHLDLSCSGGNPKQYPPDVQSAFIKLIKALPLLVSLDVSGTNLLKFTVQKIVPTKSTDESLSEDDSLRSVITDFEEKQFDYLGLFGCVDDPCQLPNLPANQVSGDLNEAQTLTALHSLRHNTELLLTVVRSLPQIINGQGGFIKDVAALVEGLLNHLQTNPNLNQELDAVAMHLLRWTVQSPTIGAVLTITHQRRILECALVVLIVYARAEKELQTSEYVIMMMNSAINMFHSLPAVDILRYCYMLGRFVETMMGFITDPQTSSDLIMKSLSVLRHSCQLRKDVKQEMENRFRLTERLVENFYAQGLSGMNHGVVEHTWGILVTLTDEMPDNCRIFVRNHGIDLVHDMISVSNFNPTIPVLVSNINHMMPIFCEQFRAYHSCSDLEPKTEPMRTMFFALGNVAEVPEIRRALMTEQILTLCRQGADPKFDGVNNSFHCVTILVHLLSEGEHAWPKDIVERRKIQARVCNSIDQWDVDMDLHIIFTSLTPMIKHMEKEEEVTSLLWASWTLCNAVISQQHQRRDYSTKVREEIGNETLQHLLTLPAANENVRRYINQLLDMLDECDD